MNIVKDTEKQDSDAIENSLRPLLLDDFIGQSLIKENLKVFIESAKFRKDTLDHTLFYGPPGLGKTTLSQIIAHEMGVGFKGTSGPIISNILSSSCSSNFSFSSSINSFNPSTNSSLDIEPSKFLSIFINNLQAF